MHRSALFAAGLVLFVLTLLVNGVARLLVVRAARASNSNSGSGGVQVAEGMSSLADATAGA